ncbi:MAG TPA: hypothetical protein VFW97_08380, partial [Acidimicrobiia bacterium]|nr:hypothetical protein [Acidimicrobiia bacterium]
MLVIAGGLTIAIIVVFAWWALRSPSNLNRAQISTGGEATSVPTPTPTTLPAAVTGAEVPLMEAGTSETDRLRTLMQRDSPGATDVVVVQIPDRAPVIAYHDPAGSQCVTVVPTPAPQAGYQGACMPNPDDIVGTLDPPTDSPTSTAYGVWTDVPAGTAYVTFTYGTQ